MSTENFPYRKREPFCFTDAPRHNSERFKQELFALPIPQHCDRAIGPIEEADPLDTTVVMVGVFDQRPSLNAVQSNIVSYRYNLHQVSKGEQFFCKYCIDFFTIEFTTLCAPNICIISYLLFPLFLLILD